MRALLRFLRVNGLLLLALAMFALMVHDGLRDPGPTGSEGDIRYAHDWPGGLASNAIKLAA